MQNLIEIKNNIERLPHYQQLLVVEHIIKHKIQFTENQNGIFLDISILENHQLSIIENFLSQIKLEDEKFNAVELEKEKFKKQLESPHI